MNGLPPASLRRRLFPAGSAGLRRSRPTRGWVKKIGPGEVSLMPSAISAINGAVSTTPIVATTTLSARRSDSDGCAGEAVRVRTSTILMLVTQGLVAELPARNAGAVPPDHSWKCWEINGLRDTPRAVLHSVTANVGRVLQAPLRHSSDGVNFRCKP